MRHHWAGSGYRARPMREIPGELGKIIQAHEINGQIELDAALDAFMKGYRHLEKACKGLVTTREWQMLNHIRQDMDDNIATLNFINERRKLA